MNSWTNATVKKFNAKYDVPPDIRKYLAYCGRKFQTVWEYELEIILSKPGYDNIEPDVRNIIEKALNIYLSTTGPLFKQIIDFGNAQADGEEIFDEIVYDLTENNDELGCRVEAFMDSIWMNALLS